MTIPLKPGWESRLPEPKIYPVGPKNRGVIDATFQSLHDQGNRCSYRPFLIFMSKLPDGYVVHHFSRFKLLCTYAKILVESLQPKSESQWLVVLGLSQSAIRKLDEDQFFRGDRVSEGHAGLIKIVPSFEHDPVTDGFTRVLDLSLIGMGLVSTTSGKWVATTTYKPTANKGNKLTRDFFRHLATRLPPGPLPAGQPSPLRRGYLNRYFSSDKMPYGGPGKVAWRLWFEKDDLWFRGINPKSLMLSMSFFVPAISTSNSDTFGPGIYAANDFDEGAKYTHPQGALMIFKNPDFRDLSVCEPGKDEWNNLTATWLNITKKMLKYLILALMPTLSKGQFQKFENGDTEQPLRHALGQIAQHMLETRLKYGFLIRANNLPAKGRCRSSMGDWSILQGSTSGTTVSFCQSLCHVGLLALADSVFNTSTGMRNQVWTRNA
ncbi:hypothetical protein N7519_000558 [Penicillium mononematosum]|uniref:uncharacterized protein n=1 Tax=Penicillium mononematosum TaxID=268346 RepID=UPI0025477627|nr:uncharacterized protein N7519_000558 [Penicillium mononematosum]KAJ6190537.1 hypothetical protein N7519_000558 [Penicillium mononematosum]